MSHYEQRQQHDLDRIRSLFQELGTRVERALEEAVHAFLSGNQELAAQVILGDGPINRGVRELDRLCYSFVAVHLPPAGLLRRMSAVIRANIAVERIGDYAVTVCRDAAQRSAPPSGAQASAVELIAGESRQMLHQALEAFGDNNPEAARATMDMAYQVDRSFDAVFDQLTETATPGPAATRELYGLLTVLHSLERVSDQARNICEETLFAATGETKKPKRYRILFLDEDNSTLGPLALAAAHKHFPQQGEYSCAGRTAAAALNPAVQKFLEQHGVDTAAVGPRRFDLTPQELGDQHLIVSLQGPVRDYLEDVPFHTTVLSWDLGPPPGGDDPAPYEALYRDLSVRIRDLMHLLRGEESSR